MNRTCLNVLQRTMQAAIRIDSRLRVPLPICGENFNKIDLMIIQGHDFLPAVEFLRGRLDEYRRDLDRSNSSAQSAAK